MPLIESLRVELITNTTTTTLTNTNPHINPDNMASYMNASEALTQQQLAQNAEQPIAQSAWANKYRGVSPLPSSPQSVFRKSQQEQNN